MTVNGHRRQLLPLRDRRSAAKRAPWAASLVRVDGGFLAFQDARDAAAFRACDMGSVRNARQLAARGLSSRSTTAR